MDLQFSGDPACLLGREWIVHDKYNLLFARIAGVYKVFDFLRPFGGSVVFTYTHMPYASQQLNKHNYTAGTVTDIFGINLLGITLMYRQWLPGFAHPLCAGPLLNLD